eukprot:TRINITY_DN23128_c0_g2_i3.p1 TRINITY_DN23128_c0_g2~~TRINITY_DN23128_c0_g2_i3.p1  ORF type:complete len:749 (-),score=111.18 TRINITY_DN23128_c0_g2_i3:374-2620(-)
MKFFAEVNYGIAFVSFLCIFCTMASSRVCFKNLPKYADEKRLREHLQQFNDFTDLKIMKTKDGKSRQFAFVGYKTPEEAQKVVKYYNKSFMDTSRLLVEIARPVGKGSEGDNQDRAWSKYSHDSSAYKRRMTQVEKSASEKPSKRNKVESKKSKEKMQEEDKEFLEFMELMQPRAKSKLWANEDNQADHNKSSDEEQDNELEEQQQDELVLDEKISDLDYLKSRMKTKKQPQEEEDEFDENRLYVRNIPFNTTETELFELFEQYGPVSQIHIVQNKATKKSKGMAYIHFLHSEHAQDARNSLNMTTFQGRLLEVQRAVKQPNSNANSTNFKHTQNIVGGGSTFKDKKQQELKEDAGNRETWNALFVRSDTITEAIAAKMGMSKEQFLDRDASDLALRLALGETQIIYDTKQEFEKQGVNVQALEEAARKAGKTSKDDSERRSRNVLLIKNLPYSTERNELQELFDKYGQITRFILPSTKVIAIVEYQDAQSARKAFRGLAYRKYQHVPLYLEWAPADIFAENKDKDQTNVSLHGEVVKESEINRNKEVQEQGEQKGVETSVIFVKNLSFNTLDEDFEQLFKKAANLCGGNISSAKIVKRKSQSGGLLSNGYGFVECDSHETAKYVILKLQDTMLDMHKLELELRKSKKQQEVTQKDDNTNERISSKLLVKNVPFEAEKKDVEGLFKPFGNVVSCRLPKKIDKSHKGYAFVKFGTRYEAKNAKTAIHGMHLLGRRLVIEYSIDDEEMQQ